MGEKSPWGPPRGWEIPFPPFLTHPMGRNSPRGWEIPFVFAHAMRSLTRCARSRDHPSPDHPSPDHPSPDPPLLTHPMSENSPLPKLFFKLHLALPTGPGGVVVCWGVCWGCLACGFGIFVLLLHGWHRCRCRLRGV